MHYVDNRFRLSRYGHLLVFGELTRIHSLFAAVALRLPISVIRNLILTQLEKQFCWNIFISISLSRSVHVITEREKKCGTLRMFVCVNEYRQTECRAFSEKEKKKEISEWYEQRGRQTGNTAYLKQISWHYFDLFLRKTYRIEYMWVY